MLKRTAVTVAMLVSSGAALVAQSPAQQNPPQSPPAPAPRVLVEKPYVRRVSIGATLTVTTLSQVPTRSTTFTTATPDAVSSYSTKDATPRIGYGVTTQLYVGGRFAFNVSLFRRQIGYTMDGQVISPTTGTATVTVTHEDTRAKVYELPAVVRFYAKDRFQPGPRVFFELGGSLRRIQNVRTAIDSSVNGGADVCCVNTPSPVRRTSKGAVAGFGVQLIDPVGIRVVPEVRYTRWLDAGFNRFSTTTRRDQIEAMLSLTF